jgi:hypothetical protein
MVAQVGATTAAAFRAHALVATATLRHANEKVSKSQFVNVPDSPALPRTTPAVMFMLFAMTLSEIVTFSKM